MSFNLPWGSQKKSTDKKDVSIDDVLPTTIQRIQLILLIVLCTDAIRQNFTAIFDESKFDTGRNTEEDKSFLTGILPGLRQAGVNSFNKWRERVLKRMGEALSVKPEVVRRAKAEYNAALESEAKRKWFQQHVEGTEIEDDTSARFEYTDPMASPPQLKNIHTPLRKLDDEKRALILNSCLFILMSLEDYSAYSRVLLHHMCYCLKLPSDVLRSSESTLALTLLKTASAAEMNADDIRSKHAEENAWGRKWKIGLATVAGAALVGVTGGLAAPIVLGAAGAIMGGVGLGGLATLLGATIANPVTIAALFGAFGGRMTGNAMDKYSKEVEEFKFIPIIKPGSDDTSAASTATLTIHKLRVIIGISGWLVKNDDVVDPWRVFSDDALEPFALQYERESLKEFGSMFTSFLRDSAYSLAQAGALGVALPAVSVAMAPLSLLHFGKLLDNPFTVAMKRSDKAGKVLAAALINKIQGERPVTLVGFSLGARVIFTCLRELASQEAFGLVESVVLAGVPASSEANEWKKIRAVVVGRVINVYSTTDYLLGFLYRTRNAQLNVAGLQPVAGVAGVENRDVTRFVTGHHQYPLAMGRILSEVEFEELDQMEVEKSKDALDTEKEKEREIHRKAKEDGKLKDEEDDEGRIIMADASELDACDKNDSKEPTSVGDLNHTSIAELEGPSLATKQDSKFQSTDTIDNTTTDENELEDDENEARTEVQMIDLEPLPELDHKPEPSIIKKVKRPRIPELYQHEWSG